MCKDGGIFISRYSTEDEEGGYSVLTLRFRHVGWVAGAMAWRLGWGERVRSRRMNTRHFDVDL